MDLTQIAIMLTALVVAATLARALGMAAVLGYLGAGVLLGPFGLGQVFNAHDAKELREVADFGVVMLLFLIGLELRPKRLWAMRQAIFGLGAAQVFLTAFVLALMGIALGSSWKPALFAGSALALSSTAFALQVMEENGELATRHGRLGFAVLLFQDIAAIPLIALTPFFALSVVEGGVGEAEINLLAFGKALATIVLVVVVGRYVINALLRVVALSKVPEAMTAAALLVVVGVALVMQQAGLSASLGSFIAGALLAESVYRHQLEADIAPFEGLLLGMFFTAIGMSLNLGLLLSRPTAIVGLTLLLMAIKAGILFGLGRWQGLEAGPSRRLALALAQGGEFAFVLLVAGQTGGVLRPGAAELLAVTITLSMVLTPLLLALERMLFGKPVSAQARAYDTMPDQEAHVVIAGFGRFGQIIARILRAKSIPFTALEKSLEQVELVRRFGSQAFYGDASRPEILAAAQIGKARAFVLAIDDVEASYRIAEFVQRNYPHVPIYARVRDRAHAHRFLDLGIRNMRRETFLSALDIALQLLKGLGYSDRSADRIVKTFRTHDERRLFDDYSLASDIEKLQQKARSDAATLEQLLREDAAEEAKLAKAEAEAKTKRPAPT
ncbi:MAG: cation:proton antiporter [Hyphomicrobiaceae bacterium]|nr:cation:proton antiporter [Hyphomicrobiaceae bacterium]